MSETFTTSDGFDVTSSSETAEQIEQALTPPESPQEKTEEPEEGQEPAEAADKPTEAPKKLGRPKKDPNARVLDAVRKERDAREALAAERAELERISQRLAELEAAKSAPEKDKEEPKEAKTPARADGRPKSDDFETWEAYEDALLEWKLEQTEKVRAEKARTEAINKEKTDRILQFSERMKAASEADPTIKERLSEDVIQLMPSMMLPPGEKAGPLNALADRFIVSEKGPALMMYFSDHADELQRMSTLTPAEFWMELGYIEKGLVSAPSLPQVQGQVSKAKPPVRPVTGSSIGSEEPDPDESFESFYKRENAKERNQARRS